jgi:predicted transcriptional regulator
LFNQLKNPPMTAETDRCFIGLTEHTADIAAAFISNNSVPVAGLADLAKRKAQS